MQVERHLHTTLGDKSLAEIVAFAIARCYRVRIDATTFREQNINDEGFLHALVSPFETVSPNYPSTIEAHQDLYPQRIN